MISSSLKTLKSGCGAAGCWRRQFLSAARSSPILLLLLVLVLPGSGLRWDSDRVAESSDPWSNELPQLDSFSEPAVAAAILQRQVRSLFQGYLLTNRAGAIAAEISATRTVADSNDQAPKQHGVAANGRRNEARPLNQSSLWALDKRLRALRSESLENLLVIHCQQCSWNDFLDAYLELLAVAPDRAAARCWTREALNCSRACGRTDEVMDALQHVTRFSKNTRIVAWIQSSLEDWDTAMFHGPRAGIGLTPGRSSSSLAVDPKHPRKAEGSLDPQIIRSLSMSGSRRRVSPSNRRRSLIRFSPCLRPSTKEAAIRRVRITRS
jgi:hypothetical protein